MKFPIVLVLALTAVTAQAGPRPLRHAQDTGPAAAEAAAPAKSRSGFDWMLGGLGFVIVGASVGFRPRGLVKVSA